MFDMDAVAKECGSPRSGNMVLLGAASPFIDIKQEMIEKAISTVFSAKGENVVAANLDAFRKGRKKALGKIEETVTKS